MTTDELRAKFESGRSIILSERRMRNSVFRDKPELRAAKIAEMDVLMAILVEFKDALKPHCEGAMEQAALLDVPAETVGKERRAEFS